LASENSAGRSLRAEPPVPARAASNPSFMSPNSTSPVWAMKPSMTRWKATLS
jgi:hypothetical protein